MNLISLSQAFDQWQVLASSIPANDCPALAESWNNYTDSLARDGQLCALQYHYAPAWDDPMPGKGRQFDALADDREFILDRMNVTVDAVFVPFSQSRNKDETPPSLNWRVTLKKDGREVITTDYMQGSAHCHAYKNPAKFGNGNRDSYTTAQRIARECETGRIGAPYFASVGAHGKGKSAVPAPDAVDVLASLLCDASALDSGVFSDWCADMGMDDDSIAARGIYDACMETALKLRAAFGGQKMDELRELFADF